MKRLPAYNIRESARAKRVIIRAELEKGLVVVLPRGTNRKIVPGILERNLEAVQRMLAATREAERKAHEEGAFRPREIDLPCLGETWKVTFLDRGRGTVELRPRPAERILEVEGHEGAEDLIREVLRAWLKRKARRHLPPFMEEESRRTGLTFDRLQFRIQKTLWGSRSSRGTISLNACLLFLEEPLVRHILIHELCHTVHMNHSRDFWNLVARYDGNWETHAAVARKAFDRVPLWVRK